jgi:hypothetical protein
MNNYCLTPYIKEGENMAFPCGKCPVCVRRRVSAWSFRLNKELERSDGGYFVTFTYNTKHVPITERGLMSLDKTDMQKYFKRLRKMHQGIPIKYVVVGEYGSDRARPHYHAIIFNAKEDDIIKAWMLNGKSLGNVYFGEVNSNSVGYVMKYIGETKFRKKNYYDDRAPLFMCCSRHIGSNYLTEAMVKWHKEDIDNRMYVPAKDGVRYSMPRYYKRKIYTDAEREQVGLVQKERSEKERLENDELLLQELGGDLDEFDRVKQSRFEAAFRRLKNRIKKSVL